VALLILVGGTRALAIRLCLRGLALALALVLAGLLLGDQPIELLTLEGLVLVVLVRVAGGGHAQAEAGCEDRKRHQDGA
jgi:hypothetical protein